ncbi:MAG: hypothetical protein ACR2M4_04950 [Actinomycetota bacterium]
MHDIDRTQVEYSPEMETYEQEQFEYGETGVFSETQAMELAAELLGVSSEAELDRFLGDLIKKAGRAVGRFVKSPVGQQLGGLLKGAAKQALPMVGSAVGGYFGGPSGAQMGGQAASAAGQMFGLELEGLSQEDQEYEAAKSYVQFAGEAVKNAASAPPMANPKAVAQSAAMAAARQLAPGLVSVAPASTGTSVPVGGRASSGRWIRRGTKIVLLGA